MKRNLITNWRRYLAGANLASREGSVTRETYAILDDVFAGVSSGVMLAAVRQYVADAGNIWFPSPGALRPYVTTATEETRADDDLSYDGRLATIADMDIEARASFDRRLLQWEQDRRSMPPKEWLGHGLIFCEVCDKWHEGGGEHTT